MTGRKDQYPRGKFNDDDEGALFVGFAVRDKTLILSFGKEVAWIGMDKQTVERWIKALTEHLKEL